MACLVERNSQIPGQDSISRPIECQARAQTTMPQSGKIGAHTLTILTNADCRILIWLEIEKKLPFL